jgi:putative addiction module component (TIGR02574 family)
MSPCGGEPQRLVIEFSTTKAPHVLGRTWPPSQANQEHLDYTENTHASGRCSSPTSRRPPPSRWPHDPDGALYYGYVEPEMRKVLSEALKLPARERVAIAEKLLESVEADGYDEDEEEIQAAWAEETQRRSRELRDGTVKGLSVEEARRIVASDPPDEH